MSIEKAREAVVEIFVSPWSVIDPVVAAEAIEALIDAKIDARTEIARSAEGGEKRSEPTSVIYSGPFGTDEYTPTAPAQSAPASGVEDDVTPDFPPTGDAAGWALWRLYVGDAAYPRADLAFVRNALRSREQTIADLTRKLDVAHDALRDAAENGLIYWDPNTERGHEQKALMLARIAALLTDPAPPTSAWVDLLTEAKAGGSDE